MLASISNVDFSKSFKARKLIANRLVELGATIFSLDGKLYYFRYNDSLKEILPKLEVYYKLMIKLEGLNTDLDDLDEFLKIF